MPERDVDHERGTLTAEDFAHDRVPGDRAVRARRVVGLGEVAQASLGGKQADQTVDDRRP